MPCRISTGSVICSKLSCSRSSARTSAATVTAGWLSSLVSGSASSAFSASGSRVKSFICSVSTPSRGAMWLRPLIAASAKPGAGTWKAKLSQISPSISSWWSSA